MLMVSMDIKSACLISHPQTHNTSPTFLPLPPPSHCFVLTVAADTHLDLDWVHEPVKVEYEYLQPY